MLAADRPRHRRPAREREGSPVGPTAGLLASKSLITGVCKPAAACSTHRRIEIAAAASRPNEPLAAVEHDIRAR